MKKPVAVLLAALLASPVLAHFHGDHQELNAWVSQLQSRKHVRCCSLDDGTLLSEPDWETQNKPFSHFRVHIEDKWVDVPDDTLVDGANRADHALVWINHLNGEPYVRCFMPGTMT